MTVQAAEQPQIDKNLIRIVVKAHTITRLLHEHGALSLAELCQLSSMERSAVFRILSTLRATGYVTMNPETMKYVNSGKFFLFGQGVLQRINFNPLLDVELKKLADKTGESVNFGVADGAEVAYLAGSASKGMIKLEDRTGDRIPMYCTAVGKALLAHYRPEYVNRLCREFDFHRFTDNTLTTPEALLADLEAVRARGYSIDGWEHNPILYCTAVPLLDRRGFPMAAVSISLPGYRLQEEPDLKERCVLALLEASGRLADAMLV